MKSRLLFEKQMLVNNVFSMVGVLRFTGFAVLKGFVG